MNTNFLKVATLVITSVILGGCFSTGNKSDPVQQKPAARQSVVTAPADLQLLCSAAAAQKFAIDRNEIIPTDSQAITSEQYVVNLASINSNISCTVTRQAQIITLVSI